MKKEEGNKRVLMIAVICLIVVGCIVTAMLYNRKEKLQKQAIDAQESAVALENTAKTEIIFRKAVWISGSRKDPADPKSRTAFERRIQR